MTFNEETLPERMKTLVRDTARGNAPIPWFVDYIDGKPEWRAMDPRKLVAAMKQMLCWVCGQKLGKNMTFVLGPMCGVTRISSEPPSHHECAMWSAQNCPFLSRPHMVRREDDLINNDNLVENSAGFALARNPGVTLLWTTDIYHVVRTPNGVLFRIGDPSKTEWICEGRDATRQEVHESIMGGYPKLKELADADPDAKGANVQLLLAIQKIAALMPPRIDEQVVPTIMTLEDILR